MEYLESKVIVDTDILIDLLRKKDYAVSLIEKLEKETYLATSAINAFELYRGAYKSQNQEKNLASVMDIRDLLIASIALVNGFGS